MFLYRYVLDHAIPVLFEYFKPRVSFEQIKHVDLCRISSLLSVLVLLYYHESNQEEINFNVPFRSQETIKDICVLFTRKSRRANPGRYSSFPCGDERVIDGLDINLTADHDQQVYISHFCELTHSKMGTENRNLLSTV